MNNNININCTWNESLKQYLVNFQLAAYFPSNPNQKEALQNIQDSIEQIVESLATAGCIIGPEDIIYSQSKLYKIGDKDCNGNEIEEICFTVPHKHVIYRSKGMNGIGFEVFTNPKDILDTSLLSIKLSNIYSILIPPKRPNYLRSIINGINDYLLKKTKDPNGLLHKFFKINCRFLTPDEKEPYYGRIASGINEYLLSNAKNSTILDELYARVISIKEKEEQLNYLTSYLRTMWITGLLSIIAFLFLPSFFTYANKEFLAMIFFSIIGGMFSTVLTFHMYKVDLNTPTSYYNKLGTIRLLTATISGVFVYCAIKSTLFLGPFASNNFSMYILAFAAGFSEQIVTKIINKVDISAVTTSNKEKSKVES